MANGSAGSAGTKVGDNARETEGEVMLESLTSAGYDLDLVRDLWRILFVGWTESETRFVVLFTTLVVGTQIRRLW